jgi:hypothetical protein
MLVSDGTDGCRRPGLMKARRREPVGPRRASDEGFARRRIPGIGDAPRDLRKRPIDAQPRRVGTRHEKRLPAL